MSKKVIFLLFLVCLNVVLAKISVDESVESKESKESKESNESNKSNKLNKSNKSSESSEENLGSICIDPNGMYPHEDCEKFWKCSNGVPIEFDCPDDLHWNNKTQECDWPDQAGCQSNDKPTTDLQTTTEEVSETTTEEASETTTEASETTTGEASETTTGEASETTTGEASETTTEEPLTPSEAVTEEATTSSSKFECPKKDGLFAHEDCWKFWQCSNWIPYEFTCPNYTAWNDFLKVCDWPSVVGCLLPIDKEICKTAESYYQDKTDCRYFYHCDLSYKAHRKQCADGLYFNEEKSECDFAINVFCFDGSNRPYRVKRDIMNKA